MHNRAYNSEAIFTGFGVDLGAIFCQFWGYFGEQKSSRKKEGVIRGLGGHREPQQGGFWWIGG